MSEAERQDRAGYRAQFSKMSTAELDEYLLRKTDWYRKDYAIRKQWEADFRKRAEKERKI